MQPTPQLKFLTLIDRVPTLGPNGGYKKEGERWKVVDTFIKYM